MGENCVLQNYVRRMFNMFIIDSWFLSYFFVKKIPLSRRVNLLNGRVNGCVSQRVSEREMHVFHTNQIGSTINSQSNFLL